MKKTLVLILVLAITSHAGAGVIPVMYSYPDGSLTGSIQTDPIGDAIPQQAFFVALLGRTASNETLHYPGDLAEFTDYTGADPDLTAAVDHAIAAYAAADPSLLGGLSSKIYFAALFDSSDPPAPVVGELITFDINGSGGAELYLLYDDLSAAYSATDFPVPIPEPTTVALLSLGGLTLPRKRR